MALAKARNFGSGNGKTGAAQSDAEVLVIAIGIIALAAVLPQPDDIFDAIAVAVEGDHHRPGTGGVFGY